MNTETLEVATRRQHAEAILEKLTAAQRSILENLRESKKVAIASLYPQTKVAAITLLDGLKAHNIVAVVNDEYVFTDEGWDVAVANLNALLKAYNRD
jgi:hypothetical protein